MRIIVCVKEVLDPDGVNAFALAGRLQIDPETKQVRGEGIPLIMNAYDAQAIEAALRLRDRGLSCTINVLNHEARDPEKLFQYAFSLGADEGYYVQAPTLQGTDGAGVSFVLARAIKHLGGADLILCGRQASDDDQGIVGPGIAILLGLPCVTVARDLQPLPEKLFRVTRVLPYGEEVVEVELPAVVTISNEVGEPRYPSVRDLMAARRKEAFTLTATDLGIGLGEVSAIGNRVRQVDMVPSEVQGHCEFITGGDVGELATNLAQRLRAEGLI